MLIFSLEAPAVTYINHFNSQFAGEVGFISWGLGKKFRKYSIGGMYGIVPTELSGGPLIETVTLRQTYDYFNWQKIDLYLGLNVYHVLGIKYQTEEYGEAPRKYYPVGSFRGLLNTGISVNFDSKESRFIYFEAGLNDLSIENILSNRDTLSPVDVLSLALGFRQDF